MTTSSVAVTDSRHSRGSLHVAELARRADVTPATVRYYARIGLLNPVRNHQNGYRRFSHDDLRRVEFIRKAQALGLTIVDIRSILDKIEQGGEVCELVVELVQQRLEEIRRQCAELESTRARIEQALTQWPETGRVRASELCPLIERVDVASGRPAPREHAKTRLRVARGARDGCDHAIPLRG